VISEFNPLDGDVGEKAAAIEGTALHQVLRDNFLKTQMSLGSTGNLIQ